MAKWGFKTFSKNDKLKNIWQQKKPILLACSFANFTHFQENYTNYLDKVANFAP
jgi:hypothetical protein